MIINVRLIFFLNKNEEVIQVKLKIDEYAINFFKFNWLIPLILPTIRVIVKGRISIFKSINLLIKTIGGILINVDKIKHSIHPKLDIIMGFQVWKGGIPILIIRLIRVINLFKLVSFNLFHRIEKIKIYEEVLWIIKYFIDWSLILFLDINGININKAVSIIIQIVSQLFLLREINVVIKIT